MRVSARRLWAKEAGVVAWSALVLAPVRLAADPLPALVLAQPARQRAAVATRRGSRVSVMVV
jgi:hypothetical protein